MANLSSGRQWPYILGIAITLVFGMCVGTVVVTSKADIQESDAYMTKYQDADAKANELLQAQIAFDKRYNLGYSVEGLNTEHPKVLYTLQDKAGKSVQDASIKLKVSRPETEKFDQNLQNATYEDGKYTFELQKLPKEGIWNIIAKIEVGDHYRFLNLKADTCSQKVYLESEFTQHKMQSYGCEKKAPKL